MNRRCAFYSLLLLTVMMRIPSVMAQQQPPASAQAPSALQQLSSDFWAWRASEQPFSGDDIPRLDRPAGWAADWSAPTISRRRSELAEFEQRWKELGSPARERSRAELVDYLLVGSAIARVRWELNYVRGWERNPWFYLDQTVASVFVILTQPPPFGAARSAEIVRRVQAIPQIIAAGEANLKDPSGPLAKLSIHELEDIRPRLEKMARELKPPLAAESAVQIDAALQAAIRALEGYRAWLEQRLPTMSNTVDVGREGYLFFLKHVALLPYTPEQLTTMGRQEWERAVAFEVYEKNRNSSLPLLALAKDQATQIAREEKQELQIRDFLEQKNILTVPAWVQHYRNLPYPAYLAPIADFGVADDLTGPTRLQDNATSYIKTPSPERGYFDLSTARDPRGIIVHEGMPGHYFQKVMSWTNEDPIRRHYYDSSANEGIGFYSEEMMLQAGLFDDSPRTREIIYNFMRFRALRVEVDVRLSTGDFTIEQAADYFMKTVPLDRNTAMEDATFYVSVPGVGISYQTGKLQILKFLAEARLAQGDKFSLREFHDFVWKNGNVPIALLRYEYLGKTNEIEALQH
ncbi:MAG TPA: DUF885 family protein [Terriglobales bacterium]|jgi:hypothetical protein|nr:DUF885 family protein [Terriglobales bacterium]